MQVHQATAIMKWSNNDYSGMDAFDRMDLAVSVTKSVCVCEREVGGYLRYTPLLSVHGNGCLFLCFLRCSCGTAF